MLRRGSTVRNQVLTFSVGMVGYRVIADTTRVNNIVWNIFLLYSYLVCVSYMHGVKTPTRNVYGNKLRCARQ
jgi:hypothetical protein